MRITLGVPGRFVPPAVDALELARGAEADGFDAVWWPDHLMQWLPDSMWTEDVTPLAGVQSNAHVHFDPFAMMAAAGAVTERIRIGVGVTDIMRRHPATLAMEALTVDHITGGRTIVGIGSGERMNVTPYGIEWRKPVSRLEEALQVIRLLWRSEGRPVDFDGSFFRLESAVLGLEPYSGSPPPIWLASHGPRMLDLCGRFADGWLPTNITPDVYAQKLVAIQSSAEAAGRDPGAITPSMLAYVLCAPDEEALASICEQPLTRLLFAAVDVSPETYARHGSSSPFPGGNAFHTFIPTRASRAEAERIVAHIPSGIVRDSTLHGTPEQIVERLRAYHDAGLRDVVLWNITPLADPQLAGYSYDALRRIRKLVAAPDAMVAA